LIDVTALRSLAKMLQLGECDYIAKFGERHLITSG
jgi:hypothetical protein